MIIPGVWILSVILHIREFGKKFDGKRCIYVWSDEVVNAVSLMWHAFAFISSMLMAALYSRVVYTLWFTRNVNDRATFQQQACTEKFSVLVASLTQRSPQNSPYPRSPTASHQYVFPVISSLFLPKQSLVIFSCKNTP